MENNNPNKKNNKKRHHRRFNKNKNKKPEIKENELDVVEKEIEEEVTSQENEAFEDLDFLEDEVPDAPQKSEPTEDEELVEVVGVRFKKVGKVYYFAPEGIKAEKGQFAIVETARGPEFGEVFVANKFVGTSEIVPPLRPIIRIATNDDVIHNEENNKKEKEAFSICLEQIAKHAFCYVTH